MKRLKPGDRVSMPIGRRMQEGDIEYVSSNGYMVSFDIPDCDEPVRRLYRFNEVEDRQ